MPACPWADQQRLEYLKENLPAYEAAQERKKTRMFLGRFHDNYFARFPQPDEKLLGLEKKRVSAWMNNHSGGRGRRDGILLRATRVSFRKLLRGRLEQKRRQKLQPTQAYSELYYESKWQPTITAEWEAKLESEPDLKRTDALAYRNMRMKQFFEDETDDVKAEVEHYRCAAPGEEATAASGLLPGEEELDENERTRRIAARDTQSAIDNVKSVLTEIVKDIEDVTGLKSHFLIAGPEPKRKGKMVMFTIAAGRTVSGNQSFKEHHPTYKNDVHDKFLSFAKACYTRETREQYANIPFPESVNSSPPSPPPPAAASAPIPSTSRKSFAPERATKDHGAAPNTSDASDAPDDSESEDDSDNVGHGSQGVDDASCTVSEKEDWDEMDIFSPHLPRARRIVSSKQSAGGLTLHQTADGQWLSETELHRLANMARNARLMKELGLDEAKRALATRSGRQDVEEPEVEDDQEFSVACVKTSLAPRERHPRQSKHNISYAEKNSDGHEHGHGHDSTITVPVLGDNRPEARVFGNATEPESGDAPETGNSVSGNAVATSNATVAELEFAETGNSVSSDAVATGNVTVAKIPVVDTSVPVPDSEPCSPHPAIIPSNALNRIQVTSAPPPTNGDHSITSDSGDVPMGVEDHAGIATPMEVDNHASLDGTPPMQVNNHASLDGTLMEVDNHASLDGTLPIQSVDLATVPVWLRSPLKHLREKFQGEVEDKILGNLVALEMAWQPFDKRIGTVDRPKAVAWWIKNARPIDRVPPCLDLASFPDEVRKWWSTIQPQWRVPVLEDWPLPQTIPAGETWQEARLGGSNGLMLIVLCLFWWRQIAEAEYDKVALAEYASVAEDVAFVFEAILSSGVSPPRSTPLTSSARANSRAGAKRKVSLQAEETVGRARSLRSSGAKENMKVPPG